MLPPCRSQTAAAWSLPPKAPVDSLVRYRAAFAPRKRVPTTPIGPKLRAPALAEMIRQTTAKPATTDQSASSSTPIRLTRSNKAGSPPISTRLLGQLAHPAGSGSNTAVTPIPITPSVTAYPDATTTTYDQPCSRPDGWLSRRWATSAGPTADDTRPTVKASETPTAGLPSSLTNHQAAIP